jgi:serine/threonine protein phosphatase 1
MTSETLNSNSPPLVLRLPQNFHGRDFVVGDIHGAYDLVIKAMRAVRFNPKVDRILSVGDLIDRGKGSARVLGFLAQPYVHAALGNHEHDFTSVDPDGIRILAEVNWNGLGWAQSLDDETILKIQAAFNKLPVVIEVPTERGLVGLVHGDVPAGMSWSRFVSLVESNHEATVEIALTGRDRIQNRDQSGVEGIGRVFVGHTVLWSGPKRFGNVYGMDTGAVFSEVATSQPENKGLGFFSMANICTESATLTGDVPESAQKSKVAVFDAVANAPFRTQSLRPRF